MNVYLKLTDNDIGPGYWLKHKSICRLGDKLFVHCRMYPRSKSFYVTATITEMTYIWDIIGRRTGAWHTVVDDVETIQFPQSYHHETKEWIEPESISIDELELLRLEGKAKIINQIPWVDWPIGHAAYLGDDGFITLVDARKTHGRFSTRKLGRRMKSYIQTQTSFIMKTHNGLSRPCWAETKQYMRRAYT